MGEKLVGYRGKETGMFNMELARGRKGDAGTVKVM